METLGSLALALVLAYLFDRVGLPGGAVLGAMAGVGVAKLVGLSVAQTPNSARFLAFVILGWLLGEGLSGESLAAVRQAAVPVALIVVSLGVATAILTWVLSSAFHLDVLTALLASSPGGLAHIASISADAGAHTTLVVAVHLARLVSVVILLPVVTRIMGAGT